jgi:hypothetical protein
MPPAWKTCPGKRISGGRALAKARLPKTNPSTDVDNVKQAHDPKVVRKVAAESLDRLRRDTQEVPKDFSIPAVLHALNSEAKKLVATRFKDKQQLENYVLAQFNEMSEPVIACHFGLEKNSWNSGYSLKSYNSNPPAAQIAIRNAIDKVVQSTALNEIIQSVIQQRIEPALEKCKKAYADYLERYMMEALLAKIKQLAEEQTELEIDKIVDGIRRMGGVNGKAGDK